jgi:hypothetical protein
MQGTGKRFRSLPNAITGSTGNKPTITLLKFKVQNATQFVIFQITNPKDYINSLIPREYCMKLRYANSIQRHVKSIIDNVPEFVEQMKPFHLFDKQTESSYDLLYPFTVLPATEIACMFYYLNDYYKIKILMQMGLRDIRKIP